MLHEHLKINMSKTESSSPSHLISHPHTHSSSCPPLLNNCLHPGCPSQKLACPPRLFSLPHFPYPSNHQSLPCLPPKYLSNQCMSLHFHCLTFITLNGYTNLNFFVVLQNWLSFFLVFCHALSENKFHEWRTDIVCISHLTPLCALSWSAQCSQR